ncbi:hypothetical protein [Thermocrispum sp.]|uniref:hypothetical protein n=1 Tax=Thermocrispum sp. TaxID=2060768 RepID=UPI00257E93ED|nr:hypothetical protein [Thermocrispum sp.]
MSGERAVPDAQDVLYDDPGGSWLALAFPFGLAAAGVAVEAVTGPVFWSLWALAGGVLLLFTVLWVVARRRFCRVRVTRSELIQGPEVLAIDRIAKILPAGPRDEQVRDLRVLGGGHSMPRKYEPVRLQLTDGTRALAWARDGEALRTALRAAMDA